VFSTNNICGSTLGRSIEMPSKIFQKPKILPLLVFRLGKKLGVPLLRVFHQQHWRQHLGQKHINFNKVISIYLVLVVGLAKRSYDL
jgi:hypothetical protein